MKYDEYMCQIVGFLVKVKFQYMIREINYLMKKNAESGFELMSIHVTYVEINAWYVILNGDRYDVCELGFCSTFIRIISKGDFVSLLCELSFNQWFLCV